MNQLRDYQTEAINKLAYKAGLGLKRLIFQLATGGGKTVSFAGLIHRYLARNKRKVLILVHREELLKQARRTLYDWYGIIAEPIVSGVRHLPNADVYVSMVETANNRLKKNPKYFGDVGLLIVDECHIGNFKKLYDYFQETLIIGFTATPISSSKKDPLKNHFEDIVCGIDIPDLIATGSLVPNKTYHVKNIKRSQLKIKNGEFDEKQMGVVYSSPKHVENCVEGYEKHCKGQKTLVFNCNVEHSKVVADAFRLHGYNCRHLDAKAAPHVRAETLQWFAQTPDAILCNVGILTTGFDEPSVCGIIVNKSTLSTPLWLQMTGRGSRPYNGKKYFTIVDMGGNALYHGDWCATRDWADMFHNPDKPKEGGVAPVKECSNCEAQIHASARICPYCGADNSAVPVYDDAMVEFELLTEARPLVIPIDELIHNVAASGNKEYAALHQIKTKIVAQAKSQWGLRQLTDGHAYKLLEMYQDKVREWCKAKKKNYNQWHKDITTQWFFSELKRVFNWEPERLEIAI
jgi:superfamily II DNA or RNA helicase